MNVASVVSAPLRAKSQNQNQGGPPQATTPDYDYYVSGNPDDAPAHPQGGAMLMGGSTDVEAGFRWMVDKADGGDFLVLRASGGGDYDEWVMGLGQLDSAETLVLKDREASSDPFVLDKVNHADAIFFAGGDQAEYVKRWKDTPLQGALNAAIARGVPVGGTSAGLAIQGGTVFSALHDTVDSPQVLADPYHPGVTLEQDFLQVPHMHDVLTDTHFSARDRMGRLVTFVARAQDDGHPVRGLGVDERTAVLLEPDGQSRVVGENHAFFVAPQGKPEVCVPGQPLTYHNLDVQKLGSGDEFDFNSWTARGGTPLTLSVDQGVLT